jgi:hypothetical protein
MTKNQKPQHVERRVGQDRSLDEAVARALRDNLAPLQRTLEDLQHAYADLTAACASSRVANALPAMLRAQTASASLTAGLGVLSHFVTIALQPRDSTPAGAQAAAAMLVVAATAEAEAKAVAEVVDDVVDEVADEVEQGQAEDRVEEQTAADAAQISNEIAEGGPPEPEPAPFKTEAPVAEAAPVAVAVPAFEVEHLATELQELHRRAKRVAKVAMQDIKMLRPKDVRAAREHKDICVRLRDDLDKARKEYDRRFKAILDHPVDYFHDSLVVILADGDPEALGEYPYPSPVLRH